MNRRGFVGGVMAALWAAFEKAFVVHARGQSIPGVEIEYLGREQIFFDAGDRKSVWKGDSYMLRDPKSGWCETVRTDVGDTDHLHAMAKIFRKHARAGGQMEPWRVWRTVGQREPGT